MKKLRDFIYDYNDILVALLIIAAAALVILWRVGEVMDYPAYLAAREAERAGFDIDFSDVDLDPEVVDDILPDPDDVSYVTGGAIDDDPGVTTGGGIDEPATGGGIDEPVPPAPAEDVRISIPAGSSAKSIGEFLAEKGLVESADAFVSKLVEMKLDTKVKAGDFTIPAGSDLETIIKIITRTN